MQVILLERVAKLGQMGEVVKVKVTGVAGIPTTGVGAVVVNLGAVAASEQQITEIEADSLERLPRNGGDNVLSQSRNERLFIGNMPVERAGGDAEGGSNAAHGDVAKPVGIKQGKSGVDNTLAVYVHLGNCTDLAGGR